MKKSLKWDFISYIIGMPKKRNTEFMKAILKKALEFVEEYFGERATMQAAASYLKRMIMSFLI